MFYLSTLQKKRKKERKGTAARLFSQLQLWFNWHFTWDECRSTVVLAVHSCFSSVGNRSVVILPSFTIALFKGNPFLHPRHQPPSHIISSARSERTKLSRPGNIGHSENRKLSKSTEGKWLGMLCTERKFSLKVNTNTFIMMTCDDGLGWTQLQ